ncbi:MAG: ABC transporter substrate-binding protein [Chloroflexi bacterium RBG_13_51_52]|nr:MAG: ABC transporter substrate-binding protein [Chloroflexi bacterium RBG_13_51_52]
MKKLGIVLAAILVLSLGAGVLFGGCSTEKSAKLKIVTSTSLIAQIVERVGGDKVNVVNIIPPAQCPGHFDVKPGDVQELADAQLFILHNWQGEKFSDGLIASADNEDLITVKVELAGNWMTPQVQRDAADRIAAALSQIDPDNSVVYQQAADEYKVMVTAKEIEVNARLGQVNLSAINVLCDEQQAGFVAWAGLNIIATYGRPETFTPQVIKDLVDQGRAGMVTLVIDNMQTGGESGKSLAEELGVTHIVLSNFPGGYENTDTWEKALDYNIELILSSISE